MPRAPLPASSPGQVYNRRLLLAAGGALLLGAGRRPGVAAQTETSESTLAGLTPLQRVAQLFTVPVTGTVLSATEDAWLRDLQPGGVILVEGNIGTAADLRALITAIHDTNPALPPLISVDQEGGLVTRLFSDPVPGPSVLATLPDAEVQALAITRGEFLADFGFAINYAPVADVAYQPDSFMADRALGSDPAAVAAKVAAIVTGTNVTPVHATAKHFPGHGRTTVDSHLALPEVDLDFATWWDSDAVPFRAAVAADVPLVMLGHLSYPAWDGLPTSLSPVAVRVLREELGFAGVVVSDDLGMAALAAYDPDEVVSLAIAAGLDCLLYVTPEVPITELVAYLDAQVTEGAVSATRIDDSVRRLLALRGQSVV